MDEPKMCVLCADRAERDRLRALNAELVEVLKSTLPWLTSHPSADASQAYLAVRLAIDKAEKGE
jgi:hypothetical protein